MQGWRNNQEDAEILKIPLDEENSALFAVFDGHGSDIVSNFCAHYQPELLLRNKSQQKGHYEEALVQTFQTMDEVMQSKVGRRVLFHNIIHKEESRKYEYPKVNFDEDVVLNEKDLIDCAIKIEDIVLKKYGKMPEFYSHKDIIAEHPELDHVNSDMFAKLSLSNCGGCTANIGLIKAGKFYVANAGDSRAVAFLKDGSTQPLSFDHKPENDLEKRRIESAGGFVSDNRVNANLALSRAFGDFTQKLDSKYAVDKQLVIPTPEIRSVDLNQCQFVILACDGIQDCVSNEELTEYFKESLDEYTSGKFAQQPRKNKDPKGNDTPAEQVKDPQLKHVVEKFLDTICAYETSNPSGTDNMTCIVVKFK